MNLKNLKDKYAKLLAAFKDAGIMLTESQQSDIDGFIKDIESTITESQAIAIQATANVLEKEFEEEYKPVIESIITNTAEHNDLVSKIESFSSREIDRHVIAEALDSYLDSRLEKALPTQALVDYDRLQTLQSLVESDKEVMKASSAKIVTLTEALEANKEALVEAQTEIKALTDVVQSNKEVLTESAKEIEHLSKLLSESKEQAEAAETKLAIIEGQKYLEQHTKDLPVFESRQLMKKLSGLTESEIKAKFASTLKHIRESIIGASHTCLEADINRIIEGVDELPEADAASNEKICDKTADGSRCEPSSDPENKTDDDNIEDGIILDESEKINPGLMKAWIAGACSIAPIDNLAGAK